LKSEAHSEEKNENESQTICNLIRDRVNAVGILQKKENSPLPALFLRPRNKTKLLMAKSAEEITQEECQRLGQ
jgi:hypothetical protein